MDDVLLGPPVVIVKLFEEGKHDGIEAMPVVNVSIRVRVTVTVVGTLGGGHRLGMLIMSPGNIKSKSVIWGLSSSSAARVTLKRAARSYIVSPETTVCCPWPAGMCMTSPGRT